MPLIRCPFCCSHHDLTGEGTCPETSFTIPEEYVRSYDSAPPLWLATVGYTSHGKSTYLEALLRVLQRLDRRLPSVTALPVGMESMQAIRQLRARASRGHDVSSTKTTISPPILFRLTGIPGAPDRQLVLYDLAGEHYDTSEVAGSDRLSKILSLCETFWLFVSLKDLENQDHKETIVDLFQLLETKIRRENVKLADRELVVVYTKGDRGDFDDHEEVFHYLTSDPFSDVHLLKKIDPDHGFTLPRYLARMEATSELLEGITYGDIESGTMFLNLVRHAGTRVHFSLVTATGGDVEQDGTFDDVSPKRVLDPLFWALRFSVPEPKKIVRSVISPQSSNESEHVTLIRDSILNAVSTLGSVKLYHLGSSRPASGTLQPTGKPRPYLIGPILEACNEFDQVLCITRSEPHDLLDFVNTSWSNRLLLVLVDNESTSSWPYVVNVPSPDQTAVVVEEFRVMTACGEETA